MRAVVVVLACSWVLAGCGRTRETTSDAPSVPDTARDSAASVPAPPSETEKPLPEPVARTRRAILDAAAAHDFAALDSLAGKDFSYTFGNGDGSPGAYWRDLEERRHVDVLGILVRLFEGPSTVTEVGHVWPSFFGTAYRDLDSSQVRELERIGTPEDIRVFREHGDYLGWRTAIGEDGQWRYFIAGD